MYTSGVNAPRGRTSLDCCSCCWRTLDSSQCGALSVACIGLSVKTLGVLNEDRPSSGHCVPLPFLFMALGSLFQPCSALAALHNFAQLCCNHASTQVFWRRT